MEEQSTSQETTIALAVRKISDLSLSNFATDDKREIILPSYDEEAAPLVPGKGKEPDRLPARLPNLAVESEVESEDQFAKSSPHQTSNFATMMHLLKANIGTGILAMPNAVSNAGLVVGTVGIPILGIICVHCMHLLVKSSNVLARKLGKSSLDYSSTAEEAFRLGPQRVQKFAAFARFAVNCMLMLTQFGFCCVYFLFVSDSIHTVVESYFGSSPIGTKGYMAMLLPFMILFNFIRSLKRLSPASSLANILQSIGLVLVFYYLLQGPHNYQLQMSAPLSKLPLYFGTAMYAFEGIGVVLPLENSMATPEDFQGLNGVLNTGMVLVACLYTAVGFYGYMKYGDAVKGSITFSLPKETMSEVIRLMFALAIFLSYALQLYVPLQIIWPFLKKKFHIEEKFNSKEQLMLELLLRTALVIITFIMAIAIPMLPLFISLVGALASSSLALIFPPIINICVSWESNISRRWLIVTVLKDVFIVLFGVFGSIVGTYTAISEIVKCFRTQCVT